jgi:hypothetical protein
MWFHILFRLRFFYVSRKCYVVFAGCRVLVVRAVICSWVETTCESMWLALYLCSRLCVYYFCLHSNKIGSAVQYSTIQSFKRAGAAARLAALNPRGLWGTALERWPYVLRMYFLEPIACWIEFPTVERVGCDGEGTFQNCNLSFIVPCFIDCWHIYFWLGALIFEVGF